MAITKYRLLIDTPGVPAGEILAKPDGGTVYRGTTHPEFWMSADMVEAIVIDPAPVAAKSKKQFEFVERK